MGRDQDKSEGEHEWVNTWVASSAAPVEAAQIVAATPVVNRPAAVAPDQLMRDIADIERVRDRLAALPISVPFSTRVTGGGTQALTLVPSRKADVAPVVIGGVLALVMLTVFGAAAAMTKLSR